MTEGIHVQLPELYAKQHEAIFSPARFSIIEASTKAGKTWGCIIWQMYQAMTNPGIHWWVAPVYEQSEVAFSRVCKMLDPSLYTATQRPFRIRLKNGSTWMFKTGDKPDNLYGEDVLSAVIDEASRMHEGSWVALRSTLTATRGPVRIIGNVKGRGNWFYRIARAAQQGAPDHHYAKLTAYDAVDAGVLHADEIEMARRQLPEHTFKELYLAEPSEDGGNPFGIDAIERCIKPMSAQPAVAWGWDVAKSQDWTVGVGLDAHGDVCAVHRFQMPWGETMARIERHTSAYGYVDATGVGDPIAEELARRGVPLEGFRFSSTSKQQLMEGLASAIQQQRIGLPQGVLVDELMTFEYQHTRTAVKYSAPQGLHDDCVCALALAWRAHQGLSFAPVPEFDSGKVPFFVSRPSRF